MNITAYLLNNNNTTFVLLLSKYAVIFSLFSYSILNDCTLTLLYG